MTYSWVKPRSDDPSTNPCPLLGSPWTNELSVAILKLGESGDLDYLKSKWWESSCSDEDHEKWSPLKPQALGGIFLILALGLALGMVIAVVELSKKSRHTAHQEKVSCMLDFLH